MKTRERWIIAACVLSRLLVSLLFPSLQNQLDKSVEFSTPFTSYRSLREGVYLLKNNFELYNGGVVHHPPLLVGMMSLIPSETAISILFAAVDALIAYHLTCITRCFRQSVEMPVWLPSLLYSFNPLVLLSCVSRSSVIFTNACISAAILYALQGDILISSVAIATAGYLSVYPLLLLIPLLSLFDTTWTRFKVVILSTATFIGLLVLSYILSGGSWEFIQSTYGSLIKFEKLFPNLGLWWYFFIEMFEMFLPFFKAVFNILVISFIAPFSLRFYRQSFYAFVICIGWITITKPYPTLGDAGFFLSFIPFFKPVFGYLRYSTFSCLLFLHAILLSPIFYHLWVDLGSGNSNFFYAITLVYALALASIEVDLTWGMLRMEYDNGKPNYELKITQI